ncbi:MAG: energy transducer TonB [Terriglobales bacterium]|jgi:TonB family protein
MARFGKPIRIVVLASTIFLWATVLGQTPAPRIRVSEGVSKVFLLTKVEPEYPQEARDKLIQGPVVMRAEISKEGDVTETEVVTGDPVLVPAALAAVKQWKYRPYRLNGQPVEVETRITLDFHLSH